MIKNILNAIFRHERNYDGCIARQWWDDKLQDLIYRKKRWVWPFTIPAFLFAMLFLPIFFLYDLFWGTLGDK